MLLETPRTEPYILVMKLSTGEEIITNVIQDKPASFLVEKPLQMVMGQQGPQFAPFMMMGDMDKQLHIFKSNVAAFVDPNPKIEEQYRTLTSTIALPKKQGIIV